MAQDDSKSRPQRLVEYFISVGVGDEAQPLENVSGTSPFESGALCVHSGGWVCVRGRGCLTLRIDVALRGFHPQKKTNPLRMS